MKKTLLLSICLMMAGLTCKAQGLTFDGVSMMQPVEQFKDSLVAKGHHVYSQIGRSYLLEGKFLGRTTNFFSIQGVKDYVSEVNVAYSFVTLREAYEFRAEAIKELKKMYPGFEGSVDDTYSSLYGETGSISIYMGSKEEFAGGDGIYPKAHNYVVNIFLEPKIKRKTSK